MFLTIKTRHHLDSQGNKSDLQGTESRKKDHIALAFKSTVSSMDIDDRFYYEPMLSGHPTEESIPSTDFLGFNLDLPIWVSSMTGGTVEAQSINTNLAKACGEYGMGMGLGSCRSLLTSSERIADFSVKGHMPDQPLYTNLGIAQIEELVNNKQLDQVGELIKKLEADGLIIHVNPLQEWLQPEGDRYHTAPIVLIKRVIDHFPDISLMVKEVGQGFGPQSIAALYKLPLAAVDFAASGGTNFSKLEQLRGPKENTSDELSKVGHSAAEMVTLTNEILKSLGDQVQCQQTIISGGVRDYLDGYYLTQKLNTPSIYGQAASFLLHARGSYESLKQHMERQKAGLQIAYSFLTVK